MPETKLVPTIPLLLKVFAQYQAAIQVKLIWEGEIM